MEEVPSVFLMRSLVSFVVNSRTAGYSGILSSAVGVVTVDLLVVTDCRYHIIRQVSNQRGEREGSAVRDTHLKRISHGVSMSSQYAELDLPEFRFGAVSSSTSSFP